MYYEIISTIYTVVKHTGTLSFINLLQIAPSAWFAREFLQTTNLKNHKTILVMELLITTLHTTHMEGFHLLLVLHIPSKVRLQRPLWRFLHTHTRARAHTHTHTAMNNRCRENALPCCSASCLVTEVMNLNRPYG